MKKFTIKKPWGSFIQFTHNEKSTVKILEIKPQEMFSLQSHQKREEFWYVLEGSPTAIISKSKKKYQAGDSIKIAKNTKHRITNNTKKTVKVLEISLGNFDEKDIIRFEDKYGRIE